MKLRATFTNGSILTGDAIPVEPSGWNIKVGETVIPVATDEDLSPAAGVREVSILPEQESYPIPHCEGLWLDSYGGIVLAEESDEEGLEFIRLNQSGIWEADGPIPMEIIANLGPFTPIKVHDGGPVRLASVPSDTQVERAVNVLTRVLFDDQGQDELDPDELYWVHYAALHALKQAALENE